MEDTQKHDIALGRTNALTAKNQRQLRYAAGQKTISGRQSMSHRNGGGGAATYGCGKELPAEKQYTGMDGGFGCGDWLNDVAFVSGIPGELAPLSLHTHNMKGGPLNVMEVIGTSRSQYEWGYLAVVKLEPDGIPGGAVRRRGRPCGSRACTRRGGTTVSLVHFIPNAYLK